MDNRLSHAVIPRYHYICTYDAALQATIAPYASWPSATGTPYAAAGTLDGNCTAAVVTGDTEKRHLYLEQYYHGRDLPDNVLEIVIHNFNN